MSLHTRNKLLVSFVLLLPILIVANGFLAPPEIRYSSILKPVVSAESTDYTLDEEYQTIAYDIGGSSVEVRFVPEDELNNLFPGESDDGMYSTNPYTYGDWIDPDLGYIPVRFTTFEVVLRNRTFAKMKIDPVEIVLLTDQGEQYHSYTYSTASAKYGNSFEDYYRARRGMSGNEYYRYEMRVGMVRGKNYGVDETVFRSDSYSGLVTFDPLREGVKRCQLQINDIVYRFDAFNRPVDVTDAVFNFDRVVTKEVITKEMREAELNRQRVRIAPTGTKQFVGNRVNDNARSELTIDRIIEESAEKMQQCFMERYRTDEVDPGQMVVSFTINAQGVVISQNVIEVVGINSENFMNCILGVIKKMEFDPIEDLPLEGDNIVKGPADPVNVLYPLEFIVYTAD